jgi:hypothetical protein
LSDRWSCPRRGVGVVGGAGRWRRGCGVAGRRCRRFPTRIHLRASGGYCGLRCTGGGLSDDVGVGARDGGGGGGGGGDACAIMGGYKEIRGQKEIKK